MDGLGKAVRQPPPAEIYRPKMLTKAIWLWICALLAGAQGVVTGGGGSC
jgi:hypothetical protein